MQPSIFNIRVPLKTRDDVFSPEVLRVWYVTADILARAGWTKQRVKNFVAEYGRVPAYRHRAWYDDSMAYGRPFMTPFNAEDSMSIITRPGLIEIIVTGGFSSGLAWLSESSDP